MAILRDVMVSLPKCDRGSIGNSDVILKVQLLCRFQSVCFVRSDVVARGCEIQVVFVCLCHTNDAITQPQQDQNCLHLSFAASQSGRRLVI